MNAFTELIALKVCLCIHIIYAISSEFLRKAHLATMNFVVNMSVMIVSYLKAVKN